MLLLLVGLAVSSSFLLCGDGLCALRWPGFFVSRGRGQATSTVSCASAARVRLGERSTEAVASAHRGNPAERVPTCCLAYTLPGDSRRSTTWIQWVGMATGWAERKKRGARARNLSGHGGRWRASARTSLRTRDRAAQACVRPEGGRGSFEGTEVCESQEAGRKRNVETIRASGPRPGVGRGLLRDQQGAWSLTRSVLHVPHDAVEGGRESEPVLEEPDLDRRRLVLASTRRRGLSRPLECVLIINDRTSGSADDVPARDRHRLRPGGVVADGTKTHA